MTKTLTILAALISFCFMNAYADGTIVAKSEKEQISRPLKNLKWNRREARRVERLLKLVR